MKSANKYLDNVFIAFHRYHPRICCSFISHRTVQQEPRRRTIERRGIGIKVVDFFNNLVNPATDTLLVRSVFANPKKANGRELKPGMFVRVKLPISQPHQALLVIDQAITSIQGRKNLYVLDDKDTVQELPVTIGQLQSDGLRVVQGKGLDDKTRVVVSKLLQVRPKTQIQPVLQPMPTYSGAEPATAQQPAVKGKGKG